MVGPLPIDGGAAFCCNPRLPASVVMPLPRVRPLSAAVLVVTLLVGCGALVYARWTAPLLAADRSAAAGEREAALAGYRAAEQRFARFQLTRLLFAREYAAAVANQL